MSKTFSYSIVLVLQAGHDSLDQRSDPRQVTRPKQPPNRNDARDGGAIPQVRLCHFRSGMLQPDETLFTKGCQRLHGRNLRGVQFRAVGQQVDTSYRELQLSDGTWKRQAALVENHAQTGIKFPKNLCSIFTKSHLRRSEAKCADALDQRNWCNIVA